MTTINTDTLRDRLHERLIDPRGLRAYCANCGAGLTETDRAEGYCTQCGEDVDDREFDEDPIGEEDEYYSDGEHDDYGRYD